VGEENVEEGGVVQRVCVEGAAHGHHEPGVRKAERDLEFMLAAILVSW